MIQFDAIVHIYSNEKYSHFVIIKKFDAQQEEQKFCKSSSI